MNDRRSRFSDPIWTSSRACSPYLGCPANRGKPIPKGERNEYLFRLASRYQGRGLTKEEQRELVSVANSRCRPPLDDQEFEALLDSAQRYPAGKMGRGGPERGFSETRVLLTELLETRPAEPDWVVPDVLLSGRVHQFYGEPGCGKTWVVLALARQVLKNGGRVLFIDEESGTQMMARRMADLGFGPDDGLDQRFSYHPMSGFRLNDVDELIALCNAFRPDLVVFDSMADMLANSASMNLITLTSPSGWWFP